MGKRANPMSVKAALTYDINEAAKALGKSPATIRNWIRDGLPIMASRKPYLILGAAIQDYLRCKYKATKRPLEADQLSCLSCRRGRKPVHLAVSLTPINCKTALLKGICEHCGGRCARMISIARLDEFAKTFKIAKGAAREA